MIDGGQILELSCRVSQPLLHVSRFHFNCGGNPVNSIIYIVGLVVVIGAVLAFLGLR